MAPARRLPQRIVVDSVRLILHREVKRRGVEPAAALAAIGIGLPPVRAGSSAAIRMATEEDRHGRSLICINRSCGARRTAEVDIRGGTRPATADRALHRAIHARVMAEAEAAAPGRPRAAVEVTSVAVVAGEDMHPAVEEAAIPVEAVTPVVEVVGIPAITKQADSKLT